MAKLGTIELVGASGTKYQFNVYPINEECPNESGIYVFTKAGNTALSPTINHTPIYIGMAASFEKRFYNHHKDDCIDEKGANRICLMQVKTEPERIRIEKDLLAKYATKCNEVNNPITPK